jgi:ABC-type sugar transport system ATPase subunit
MTFSTPMEARAHGIETIYQDLALANNLDVGANIFLGREVKKRWFGGLVHTLDDRGMEEQSRRTLEALQIRIPTLAEPIETLSGGQRQAVAIARAVYWDAKLMIMDEPTNNLGVPEQHKVLELIRTLRDRGVPVILITHILPDAFAATDRVVVMHRGRKVAEKVTAQTNAEELVQYMVGARDDDVAA